MLVRLTPAAALWCCCCVRGVEIWRPSSPAEAAAAFHSGAAARSDSGMGRIVGCEGCVACSAMMVAPSSTGRFAASLIRLSEAARASGGAAKSRAVWSRTSPVSPLLESFESRSLLPASMTHATTSRGLPAGRLGGHKHARKCLLPAMQQLADLLVELASLLCLRRTGQPYGVRTKPLFEPYTVGPALLFFWCLSAACRTNQLC